MTPPANAARTDRAALQRVMLRVLDHQVVREDDELLGNVDDLELELSDDGWRVTGLLVGPGALGQRLPGKLGRWTVAIWRRLQTDADPHPARVDIEDVLDVGSTVRVTDRAAEELAASFGLERWLREYVVSRIPGAKGGGDDRDDGGRPRSGRGRTRARATSGPDRRVRSTTVSTVVGSRVFARDGSELGVVHELLCTQGGPGRTRDRWRVTHLQYGHHAAGSKLGYDAEARQGPWVVGALVRWWQRGHRVAPIEDVVDIDLEARTLRLTRQAGHVHPHEL